MTETERGWHNQPGARECEAKAVRFGTFFHKKHLANSFSAC